MRCELLQLDLAMKDFQRAANLDPENPVPFVETAKLLAMLDEEDAFFNAMIEALQKGYRVWEDESLQSPEIDRYTQTARFQNLVIQFRTDHP